MNKTTFNGYLRASADQTHPLQTNLEFVFTDFLPNVNKQGVREAEAENIIRTGIHMPVKVNFNGGRVRGHPAAMPVGPIVDMRKSGDQIIGHAVVWKDEFEDFANYLEKASASEENVQFSWELYYKDAEVDDAGVSWLNDCVVAGTTIVANPAYAGRTPLLALAEEDVAERITELEREVAELQTKLSAQLDGSQTMDPLEVLQAQVADLQNTYYDLVQRLGTLEATVAADVAQDVQDAIETLQNAVDMPDEMMAEEAAAEETTEAETNEEVVTDDLTTELEELRKFKADVEAEKARAEILTNRRTASKEVISDDDFNTKVDFILSLDDTQFQAYVESLVAVATKAKASASVRGGAGIPDPVSGLNGSQITLQELAKGLRDFRSNI